MTWSSRNQVLCSRLTMFPSTHASPGRLRVKYAGGEEVLSAGEVYYLAPGHIPVVEEPLEIVEFSPSADYEMTTAALTA